MPGYGTCSTHSSAQPTTQERVALTELKVPPDPITLSVYRLLEPPEDVWPKAMSN